MTTLYGPYSSNNRDNAPLRTKARSHEEIQREELPEGEAIKTGLTQCKPMCERPAYIMEYDL